MKRNGLIPQDHESGGFARSGTSMPQKFFFMLSVVLYVFKVVFWASLRFAVFYAVYRFLKLLVRSWRSLGK